MKIGVKYCGGCNPAYERGNIVKWLKLDYPMIDIEAIREDVSYDFCLIICGCREECSDYSRIKVQYDVLVVCDAADYDKVKKYVKDKLNGEKG